MDKIKFILYDQIYNEYFLFINCIILKFIIKYFFNIKLNFKFMVNNLYHVTILLPILRFVVVKIKYISLD